MPESYDPKIIRQILLKIETLGSKFEVHLPGQLGATLGEMRFIIDKRLIRPKEKSLKQKALCKLRLTAEGMAFLGRTDKEIFSSQYAKSAR